jgi:hypothetical protein
MASVTAKKMTQWRARVGRTEEAGMLARINVNADAGVNQS